jgi:FkbM family methyltransferase
MNRALEHPLVSIVTPSFNQAQFLQRTVDSVLGQTYPNIEYIVVDGGSNDGSVEILRSYGDRFAWISEPDRGQSHAINKGLARASGEILAYLNSDDVLLPRAAETVVRYLQDHPDGDLVYGTADYIDEHDNVTGSYHTADYTFTRLMHNCCICQPATFWRATAARLVGPFNESLSFAMDYEHWIRLDRANAKLVHIPERLAQSRLHASSKTRTARRQIYREIFEVSRREGGYVDYHYFISLWRELLRDRDRRLQRLVRFLPNLEDRMAYLHHKWWNRHLYSWRDLARVGRRVLAKRTRRLLGRVRAPANAGRRDVADLYHQEPEVQLLGAFLPQLRDRTVIDVGAELGSVTAALLQIGANKAHVIDPHPGNAKALRERFRDDRRVTVHELAISDRDGAAELHVSADPSGVPISHGHSLLSRGDSETLVWHDTVTVPCRSVASLVEEGTLPSRAGILKVDTEGHDLAVVSEIGELACDVVMVEHWTDLPRSLGPCPWTTDEIVDVFRALGYSHFLLVAHHGEYVTVTLDGGEVSVGEFGNLIFLHDAVVTDLLPAAADVVSVLSKRAHELRQLHETAPRERPELFSELDRSLRDTLRALEESQQALGASPRRRPSSHGANLSSR